MFTAVRQMRIGKEDKGAAGIWEAMGVYKLSTQNLVQNQALREIEQEFTTVCGHCDQDDIAIYQYVCTGVALEFLQPNGKTRDKGHHGMTLEDFCAKPAARDAKLTEAHVLALRLYTSNSYYRINNPLREPTDGTPAPYAATTFYIREALLRLRGLLKKKDFPKTFYRGMKDMEVMDEFVKQGGTEMACMSTSADKAEALKFASSRVPLLLQIEVENHMQCGADISWLSMYPEEKEWLFPPLTYLDVKGKTREDLTAHGEWWARTSVYHVRPAF